MKIPEYLDEYASHMSNADYRCIPHTSVKKYFSWKFSLWGMLAIMWIIFFIIGFIVGYSSIDTSKKIIIILWYLWLCLIVWVLFLVQAIKTNKAKNYKRNWKWIKECLSVCWIKRHVIANWSFRFDWYYVEATDWENIYCSDAYNLSEINMNMEIDTENNGISYCNISDNTKEDQNNGKVEYWNDTFHDIIHGLFRWETFPQSINYREVNWHKIAVQDMVDVYIDPDNPKYYWVDIDFLFEK